jgi:hypothetical protein
VAKPAHGVARDVTEQKRADDVYVLESRPLLSPPIWSEWFDRHPRLGLLFNIFSGRSYRPQFETTIRRIADGETVANCWQGGILREMLQTDLVTTTADAFSERWCVEEWPSQGSDA